MSCKKNCVICIICEIPARIGQNLWNSVNSLHIFILYISAAKVEPFTVYLLYFTCPLNIPCFFFSLCHCHFDNQEQSGKQGNHNNSNVLQTLLYRHKYLFHPFFPFSIFFFQKKRFTLEIIHHPASLGQTNPRRIHLVTTQQ